MVVRFDSLVLLDVLLKHSLADHYLVATDDRIAGDFDALVPAVLKRGLLVQGYEFLDEPIVDHDCAGVGEEVDEVGDGIVAVPDPGAPELKRWQPLTRVGLLLAGRMDITCGELELELVPLDALAQDTQK